ncbi:hypothetical protein ABIC08_009009 [Bradyrhizobium sp. RT9b]
MPGVFPDYKAPIVRNGTGRELTTVRWGMPSSSRALMDATRKRAEKLQAKGKSVDFKELLRKRGTVCMRKLLRFGKQFEKLNGANSTSQMRRRLSDMKLEMVNPRRARCGRAD